MLKSKQDPDLFSKILRLYTEYTTIYGPYFRKDNRFVVVLYNNKTFEKTTKQLCKLILEVDINRRLTIDETVDHIDGNSSNDSIDNLQILSRSDNAKKSVLRRHKVFGNCQWCNLEFELTKDQIQIHKNKNSKKAGPFCSKRCAGLYGKQVQTAGIKLQSETVSVSYWKQESS